MIFSYLFSLSYTYIKNEPYLCKEGVFCYKKREKKGDMKIGRRKYLFLAKKKSGI